MTVENIKGLNQSDYQALDYVGRYGGIFDPDFYLKEYPLVARSSINPLTHYVTYSQQFSYLAPNSVLRQPDILIASITTDELPGVRPPNPLETIVGLFVLGGELIFDAVTGTWEFFRETSTDDILQAIGYAGEGLTFAPGVNLIDVSLINPNNTPPFIIPAGTEEGEITIEVFPGGVNVEEILDGSIFVSPDASEIEFSGVVTTPKQTQNLDELLGNSVFTFPGDTKPDGSYFYTSASEQELLRGLIPRGSLNETTTDYERLIGEALLSEGNVLIGVDDNNVRIVLDMPKTIQAADYLSVTPSGRFNLTEVKGSSPTSTTGAKIGDAINQLTNTYNALIQKIPGAKLGKVEIAVPEGAPLDPAYQLSGNQIIRVTLDGTEVVRVGGKVVTIRR